MHFRFGKKNTHLKNAKITFFSFCNTINKTMYIGNLTIVRYTFDFLFVFVFSVSNVHDL